MACSGESRNAPAAKPVDLRNLRLDSSKFFMSARELPQGRFQLRALETGTENQVLLLEECAMVAI